MKDLTGNNWLIADTPTLPVRIDTPVNVAVIDTVDAAIVGTYKAKIGGTSQLALQFITDSADAIPKVTIHGSNDGINWDAYEVPGGGTTTDLPMTGSHSILRDTFPHEYIAVSVDKNGGTEGTILCSINLKNQTS